MATNTAKNNVASKTSTLIVDRTSLWIVIVTLVIILIVIITGVCVWILLDQYVSSIILICLICFLAVLGIVVLSVLAVRNRRFSAAEQVKVVTLRKGPYQSVSPSAPGEEPELWNYSNRETIPA